MNSDELGELVQRRRGMLKIDQRTLAELAGVSVHTISNLESGKGNPTLRVLGRVLGVLGLQIVVRPKATIVVRPKATGTGP